MSLLKHNHLKEEKEYDSALLSGIESDLKPAFDFIDNIIAKTKNQEQVEEEQEDPLIKNNE